MTAFHGAQENDAHPEPDVHLSWSSFCGKLWLCIGKRLRERWKCCITAVPERGPGAPVGVHRPVAYARGRWYDRAL